MHRRLRSPARAPGLASSTIRHFYFPSAAPLQVQQTEVPCHTLASATRPELRRRLALDHLPFGRTLFFRSIVPGRLMATAPAVVERLGKIGVPGRMLLV